MTSFTIPVKDGGGSMGAPPVRLTTGGGVERRRRRRDADEVSRSRENALEAYRQRCAERVMRAKRLVEVVKEEKMVENLQRRRQLERSLVEAEKRRAAQRGRKGQETVSPGVKSGSSQVQTQPSDRERVNREMRREQAAVRRKCLLEEKRRRAAAFASSRRAPGSNQSPSHARAPQNVSVAPPCSGHMESNEESGKPDAREVCRIQRVWRLLLARRLIHQHGLHQSSQLSFEECCNLIQNPKVMRAAFLVICAVNIRRAKEWKLTRILLSCILMSTFPQYIFSTGAPCSELDRKALRCARRMCAALLLCRNPAYIRSAWLDWVDSFQEWQRKDSQELEDSIIRDAVATEQLRHSLRERASSPEEADDFDRCINERQVNMRNSLHKLKGAQGVERLDGALRRGDASSGQHQLNHESEGEDGNMTQEDKIDLTEERIEQTLNDVEALERFVMAHELVLHFELLDFDMGAAKRRWRCIRSSCTSDAELFHQCLVLIPEEMSSFAPGVQVAVGTEFSLIENDVVPQTESLCEALDVVHAGLKSAQAAAQDEDLDSWRKALIRQVRDGSLTQEDFMREVFLRVQQVKHEVQTYRMCMLIPTIRAGLREREQQRFLDEISRGRHDESLPITKEWLQRACQSPSMSLLALHGRRRLAQILIHFVLIELSFHHQPVDGDVMPEILDLDTDRVRHLQDDFQRVVLLNTLHVVARNFIAQRFPVSDVLCHLNSLDLSVVDDLLHEGAPNSLGEIQTSFEHSVVTLLSSCETPRFLSIEDREALKSAVRQSAQTEDPVFHLLQTRLMNELRLALANNGNAASETLHLRQFHVDQGSIRRHLATLQRIGTHAMSVHGERILKVVSSLLTTSEHDSP
mmetsp:Transcript_6366/g.12682  ORF Transcript_6366/g.12682 Transcript_6366/m.12682 type:complete len:864 (-) Transcript_6366:1573-4164(-)